MIKYNTNIINDWNFDASNVIKVYRNNAIVFYKVSGESPTPEWKVCFAVVDDISQYTDREFEDVYDKATEKWYKLNNLNQYEVYGVYGNGRNVTTYDGKLTVDDGYEYEWNGSSWVNVGEVTGSSKTSDFKIGDIDTPITNDASLITDGMYGVILPVSLSANTSSAVALMGSSDTNTLSNLSSHTKTEVISENDIIDYAVWKFHGTATANTFYVENVATKKYFGYSNVSSSSYMPLVDESSKVPTVFSAFTYNNVTALGICKGDTPNQYYAINDLYTYHHQYNWFNLLSQAGDLNNSYVIYKVKGSDAEYPKYYTEKSEPLDNLTFNTMADAVSYAQNNCVYDGMKATIGTDRYYFDSSDENGWVEYESRVPDGYTELQYCTVPMVSNTSQSFMIKSKNNVAYDYTISFMPIGWESNSYYKYLIGGSEDYPPASMFSVFSLDNGWSGGRWIINGLGYAMDSRKGGFSNKTRFYDNVNASVTMCYNERQQNNGIKVIIENEGYDTYTGVSTTIVTDSGTKVDYDTEYDIPLFTSYKKAQYYTPNMRFYNFKVYDTVNETDVYHYVPVKRDSDDKVGICDIVSQNVYFPPTHIVLTAGPIV